MTHSEIPSIPLAGGTSIPQIGLGTSPLTDDEVRGAVVSAVELGYRHIDTAAKYGNERGVGAGIRDSGIAREQIFVTTKLDGAYQGDDKAVAGLDGSLERLGLDYVDLLLIHWPLPARDLYVSTWRTYEALLKAGKTRAIGVSNFKPAHLQRLIDETGTAPAVNQVQLNPFVQRRDERAFGGEHGIPLLSSPAITTVAAAHGKTPGQVVVRWHVQNGLVAIPKSKTPSRQAENLDVFDFELSEAELDAIAALNGANGPGSDSEVVGH
jgi:2,5-diketo-D-gluconate reductase A